MAKGETGKIIFLVRPLQQVLKVKLADHSRKKGHTFRRNLLPSGL